MGVTKALDKVTKVKFNLGSIVATPGVINLMDEHELSLTPYIFRHVSGDWGDVDDETRAMNDEAVENNGRIHSVYQVNPATKIWIITEWTREVTTALLPSEY